MSTKRPADITAVTIQDIIQSNFRGSDLDWLMGYYGNFFETARYFSDNLHGLQGTATVVISDGIAVNLYSLSYRAWRVIAPNYATSELLPNNPVLEFTCGQAPLAMQAKLRGLFLSPPPAGLVGAFP